MMVGAEQSGQLGQLNLDAALARNMQLQVGSEKVDMTGMVSLFLLVWIFWPMKGGAPR